MNAPQQGNNTILIEAPTRRIWELLADSRRLAEWAPMVKATTAKAESLNSIRRCDVEFNGKPGTVTERCCHFDPMNRIGWEMVEDSLGFGRMIEAMGFDFRLESLGPNSTRVVNTTYYKPRTLLAKIMSALMMKRSFRRVRETVLGNLKQIAEAPPT